MDSSTIQSGRVYLRNLEMKELTRLLGANHKIKTRDSEVIYWNSEGSDQFQEKTICTRQNAFVENMTE